ncbi:hypothetical protein [Ancylobacter terrae]|uniref:hypothetical protein n=1 Tax=Ancylobacter sp. sgz301288 TaxID=3342077 RepID=UPI00385ADF80
MRFAMRLKGLDRLMRRLTRMEADRAEVAAAGGSTPPARPGSTGGSPPASGRRGRSSRTREEGR